VLRVDGVGKTFGSLVALAGISLTVKDGELRAIIGPNGAGKTTLFNIICGSFPPTTGTIAFDGADITALPAHARVALGIARTFQITEIFPELTVFENVRISTEVARYRCPWIGTDSDRCMRRSTRRWRSFGEVPAARRASHGDQRAAEIAMALALTASAVPRRADGGMGEQRPTITQLIAACTRTATIDRVIEQHAGDLPSR
jgi:branched-chain amino acid transport system ATP-binding protein